MKYDGMLQILRYNLPMYLAALTGCLAVAQAVALLPLPRPLAVHASLGATGAFLLPATSLLASHYIYDLSPLSSWSWIAGLFSALRDAGRACTPGSTRPSALWRGFSRMAGPPSTSTIRRK